MWAAASGKCDVVTELISLGADVDIQTNVSHFLYVTVKMVQDPPSACVNCLYSCHILYLWHTFLMGHID